jgi:hypothetical protein
MPEEPENLIDTGTFDEMLTLASQRALAEGGVVVVHRKGCEGSDDCLCRPRILQPYEPLDEAAMETQ